MPANTKVNLLAGQWTLLASTVTAIRLQHGGARVYIMGTVGAVPPVGSPTDLGAIFIDPGKILATDVTLAMLFPGVASTHVYGYCDVPNAVSISYA